ncbi:hypothetical protein V6N13_149671 [Hibiscus sabdariffa]
MATSELKRITGFIEEEALFKLNKCAVGTMASVCNTSYVEDKLSNRGFGELSIKSLAVKEFECLVDPLWWVVPSRCLSLKQFVRDNVVLTLSGQLFFGVANFDGAGCGETLRTEGGHFRTLFFGPVLNYGADFATLSVVKVTLEVLVETNWSEDDVGLIELESQKGVISMAASLVIWVSVEMKFSRHGGNSY